MREIRAASKKVSSIAPRCMPRNSQIDGSAALVRAIGTRDPSLRSQRQFDPI